MLISLDRADQILAAMQTDNLSAKGLHAGDVFNTDTYESHKIALLICVVIMAF